MVKRKPQQPDGCEDFIKTSNAADRLLGAPLSVLSSECSYYIFQFLIVGDKHLTWAGALLRADNAGGLKLVHYLAGAGIAESELSLQIGGRAFLGVDDHACGVAEKGVDVGYVNRTGRRGIVLTRRGRKVVRRGVALLIAVLSLDELRDAVDFLSVDESALDTLHLHSGIEEHVSPTDEAFRARRIEDCLGVNA